MRGSVKGRHTRARISWSWASILCSSSEDLRGGWVPEEKCE